MSLSLEWNPYKGHHSGWLQPWLQVFS